MIIHHYHKATGEYLRSSEARIDPLETKKQGRDVYLLPAHATDIAPPKLEIIPYQTLIGWFEHLRIEIKFDNPKVKTTLWGLKS